MRKRQLAALVAAAALAASAPGWAGSEGQPMSYNTTGNSANDASSNHMAGGEGYAHGGGEAHGGAYPPGGMDAHGGAYAHNGGDAHGGDYAHGGGNGEYGGNGGGSGEYGGDASSPDLLKHGTGVSQQALLDGGNEVGQDGKAAAGEEDGRGAASLSLDPEAGTLCFGIVVNNLDGPVAAHIHQGAAGYNGPVVITLKAPDSGDPGASSGCITQVDRALLHAIHAHPWAYYVNVHTGAYPDGAIRGQLY